MDIKPFVWSLLISVLCVPALAQEAQEHDHKAEHGGQINHRFLLKTDMDLSNSNSGSWDWNGWIGTDENKLWLKTEGERHEDATEKAEFWGLYSRNIANFWDGQIGLRHDTQPNSVNYLALGLEGLAPYFFETEAHMFVSDDGDVTARLRQENDLLLTQRLIAQPYFELNLSAQDVPEQEIGAGLTDVEIGLQTRYEIHRKLAPYLDLRYERKFGETADIAESDGENKDDFVGSVGLRVMF